MLNFKEILDGIKAFSFDVDGVFTDGSITMMPDGSQIRSINSKDLVGLQHALKKGYKISIITSGASPEIKKQMNAIGITDVFLKSTNKLEVFEDWLLANDLNAEQVLYMGDDVPDYGILKKVAASTCPADAASEIKQICLYVSTKQGGKGCVRDVIEQVMRTQNNWIENETIK